MDALVSYSWPGNIRELENLLERAVILSPGKELRVPFSELRNALAAPADESPLTISTTAPVATLEEAERQHILRALRQTEWRIARPRGAPVLLGINRPILQSPMP